MHMGSPAPNPHISLCPTHGLCSHTCTHVGPALTFVQWFWVDRARPYKRPIGSVRTHARRARGREHVCSTMHIVHYVRSTMHTVHYARSTIHTVHYARSTIREGRDWVPPYLARERELVLVGWAEVRVHKRVLSPTSTHTNPCLQLLTRTSPCPRPGSVDSPPPSVHTQGVEGANMFRIFFTPLQVVAGTAALCGVAVAVLGVTALGYLAGKR